MTDPGPRLTRTEACHMLIVLAVVCFFVALFFTLSVGQFIARCKMEKAA